VEFLLKRSGRPPAAPKDWQQQVELSCSSEDCIELQTFTLDPVERTHRFRVRQDRRLHLQYQIQTHPLDMTDVTVWIGRVQGHDCDGNQGKFWLLPAGYGGKERQEFTFSNDGGIALVNTPNRFAGTLESSAELTGPYAPVAGAWSPFVPIVNAASRFYRIR